MTHCCPHCGLSLHRDDFPTEIPGARDGGPTFQRAVEVLRRHRGQWVPSADLVRAVYSDRYDGGPLNAPNVLSVTINRARHKLIGWRIEGKPWWGYRLVEVVE